MIDLSFLNHEQLQNMDPRKVQILMELASQSEGRAMKDMAPLLTAAMKRMQSEGVTFTPDESSLMIEILTSNMSPADKQKVKMMQSYMNK